MRTGLHTGECERRGDDLAGIAVHIGARVAARAQAGEVLVTSTVRDLVAGSGIMFTDRGEQALKGVPAPWRLLAVDVGREVGPMTCPARGRENRAGLRFCEECDAALFALLCHLRR